MARVSRAQEFARTQMKTAASSGLPPDQMGMRMMDALRSAIGWDGFRLFGVDSSTLLINRLLAASDNDAWARKEWLREVYLSNEALPYIELPNILRGGLRGVAYQDRQEQSWGYPREWLSGVSAEAHWRYFHESRSPAGGVLLAGFAHGSQWVAAMQAYRRDSAAPFRRTDVEFLKTASAIIGPALRNAIGREQALCAPRDGAGGSPDSSGIVILSADGELRFSTPAGEVWMDLMRTSEHGSSGMLPTALWSAMLGYRREQDLCTSRQVIATTAAGAVTLDASAADDEGGVAIVISPRRRLEPPPVPDHWPLTDQQRQIVLLVASGMSNRQMAEALFVGEHTVEWHLRQIYGRLDIGSRTQLLSQYFREAVLGGYYDPAAVDDEDE
jgi:DNA-binding CsgD family transcriptional regulator